MFRIAFKHCEIHSCVIFFFAEDNFLRNFIVLRWWFHFKVCSYLTNSLHVDEKAARTVLASLQPACLLPRHAQCPYMHARTTSSLTFLLLFIFSWLVYFEIDESFFEREVYYARQTELIKRTLQRVPGIIERESMPFAHYHWSMRRKLTNSSEIGLQSKTIGFNQTSIFQKVSFKDIMFTKYLTNLFWTQSFRNCIYFSIKQSNCIQCNNARDISIIW